MAIVLCSSDTTITVNFRDFLGLNTCNHARLLGVTNVHELHAFNGRNSPFGKLVFYFFGKAFAESCPLKPDIIYVV